MTPRHVYVIINPTTTKGADSVKNKKILIALICFFGALAILIGALIAVPEISDAIKEQEYISVYKEKAEEYIRYDEEILSDFGGNISIRFVGTTVRYEDDEGLFDSEVPDSLEEFIEEVERIEFNLKINGEKYELVFINNGTGDLVVAKLARK